MDAAGVGLNRTEQVAPQPGNLHKQPRMGSFADRQEQPDVVFRQAKALAECGDVRRKQCHLEVGQRNADVCGADHFA